jgi:hypothetical protein
MNSRPATRSERRMFEAVKGRIPTGEKLFVTVAIESGLRIRMFYFGPTLH